MVEKRKLAPVQTKRGGYLLGSLKRTSIAKKSGASALGKHQRHGQPSSSNAATPYKGVRMRVWGKWVTEIRDPITKTRIWLGSFATAEMAARAYDAAVVCLKGSSAPELNFPNSIPPFLIPQSTSSPKEIQAVALAAATASVPAAAPLALQSSEAPRKEVEIDVMDSASSTSVDMGLYPNADGENGAHAMAELAHSSNEAAMEDWISKEFGELNDSLDQESCNFYQELLKQVDEAEMAYPLSQFNVDGEQPGLFPWSASEETDDTLLHDVELWSFNS